MIAFIPGTNYFAPYSEFVNIALTNEFKFAVLADCIGNPNVVATDPGIFWVGCFMIRNDIMTGNNVYVNQGTLVSPLWILIGSGGGGGGFTYKNEIVSGSGTMWTLAHTPTDPLGVLLFGGGSNLIPGVDLSDPNTDYFITGNIITTRNSYSAKQVLANYS